MAALFYTYSSGEMFKTSIPSSSALFKTDLFDTMIADSDNLCILTQISVTTADIIQPFVTFDDFVHYFYFGKGVGNISISGLVFMDCQGAMPGLNALFTAVGQRRGTEVNVILSNIIFTGVLQDCNITLVGEPDTMVSFTANFMMINHHLPGTTYNITGPCGGGYTGSDSSDGGAGNGVA